jgi:uncharacterized membrane protein YccC
VNARRALAYSLALALACLASYTLDAWQQPLLRAVDTAVGIAVGLAASWLLTTTPLLDRARRHLPAQG